MSEKKRKRSEKAVETPRKKTATEAGTPSSKPQGASIQVKHHSNVQQWGPMLGSTPGFSLPKNTAFSPFVKHKELLLHSSSHPRLSYSAQDKPNDTSSQETLAHYMAVFNPQTATLDVIPTRHITLRSTLKSEDDEVQRDMLRQAVGSTLSARQQLGLEFGNKKAKKMIESLSQNAISPSQPERLLATDAEARQAARDALRQNTAATAVLDGISAVGSGALTQDERDKAASEAQPRPKPDLNADEVEGVYPAATLIGSSSLNSIRVKDWIDAIAQGEDIQTHSRFVSSRVAELTQDEDTTRLKLLRYMLVLIELHALMRSGGKAMEKKLPKAEVVKEKLSDIASEALIEDVKRRFTTRGEVTKWQLDNLFAHLAAMSLVVSDFETETRSLAEDLKLPTAKLVPYYRIVGARVGPPTEQQQKSLGVPKSEKVAKLRLPLDFPKQRRLPVKNRGTGR